MTEKDSNAYSQSDPGAKCICKVTDKNTLAD